MKDYLFILVIPFVCIAAIFNTIGKSFIWVGECIMDRIDK